MAKHKSKFSSSQRWAIWTAYGMKCFWCKKTLDFTECEIDYVIPQSTSKIVLSSLTKDYQLGADFSTSGYANCVAACIPCTKRRAKGPFRTLPALPGWFDIIRQKIAMVEAKVNQIEGEQSIKSLLQALQEKLERGEITREDLERVAGPFLRSVEGTPKGTVEFRLSPVVRIFSSPDGMRLQPPAEIKYEKFVERMVESGDWKRRSTEQLNEGPSFGEGRRKPRGGA